MTRDPGLFLGLVLRLVLRLFQVQFHHQGTFPALVGPVIIRPLTDHREPVFSIEFDSGRVAGPDFQEYAIALLQPGQPDRVVEQNAPKALPLLLGGNAKIQQVIFSCRVGLDAIADQL